MVLAGNFLKLGLGLSPPQNIRSAGNRALTAADIVELHSHDVGGIPSYARDISRFHHTVKRARSIIESREDSVAVPKTELHGILTKLEDLEEQVKALLNENGGSAPTSPAPGMEPASSPASGDKSGTSGSGDQDCDAENLIYDLGARAVVDADGQVSGHPLFRRNANCAMESAVNGKNDGSAGGSSESFRGSGKGGAAEASPSMASDTTYAGGQDGSNSSPSTGDASSDGHQPNGSMGKDSSSEAQHGDKTNDPGLSRVVSAAVETIETKTLPVDGKLITTTITRTTTIRSTVTIARYHGATGSAEKETPDGTDRSVITAKRPEYGGSGHAKQTAASQDAPVAPSVGSFKQFTNSTSKLSYSTLGSKVAQAESQETPAVTVDDKSFNHTSTGSKEGSNQMSDKPVRVSEEARNSTNRQGSTIATPKGSGPVQHTSAAPEAIGTPLQQKANLTMAGNSGEKASNTATVQKSSKSTSRQEYKSPAAESNNPNEKIAIVTVVPIPAKVAGVTPSIETEKPEALNSASVAANETVPRPMTGFKTVRMPAFK
ncbi:hypothetical protein ED733_001477 [Metarhizium rileyi]|uniref:Uncharacterized protein n=1 Tax=Metarhizium rileyi (strain RCEF 4871) TaxID=1649241 RepID=A0A5C6G9K3_METRR|nr:hypothetical protein ED733_001477 [Metarhizium rileyi]